jgi:hypothetical protein
VRAYARGTPEINRVILAGFVLGLSSREGGETLVALLGRPAWARTSFLYDLAARRLIASALQGS